jgi:apolipoprotein D and lipocalin family protein
MRLLLLSLALLSAAWQLAPPNARAQPLRVVDSLDLKRYAGRWYEVARLPNKFQRRCASNVVAYYSLRTDNRIDVVNRCQEADGKVEEAHGIARRAHRDGSGARLEVRFARGILSFLPGGWADYWVIGLGPDYTWAVVGTPSREHLWILSRVPQMTAASYEHALEIAKGKGFDVTRLVQTAHNTQRSRGLRSESSNDRTTGRPDDRLQLRQPGR